MSEQQTEIYVKWDRYGWVASTPGQEPAISFHCSGPHDAAQELAKKLFGPKYDLKFVRRGAYIASRKSS